MQSSYDLKRYSVLYVDDEEMALKYFEKAFGREFRILTANNAVDGLKILEQHGDEIGVLLTDQRMPGEKGVQLLEKARQLRPRLVRMLITAFADFGVTVDAVNLGNIFRYISKPLQIEDMRNTLRRAMEFYILQQERDDLLREKLSVLHNMLITDRVISLGVLAAGLNRHLRNPLQAVQAFLELTPGRLNHELYDLEKLRDPAFWRDFHNLVVKQAERIAAQLGELDDVANTTASGEHIDSAALLNSVIEHHRRDFVGKNIELKGDITGPLPLLQGNPRMFQKIFELLLRCELSTLTAGKTVTIAARAGQSGSQPTSLQISISDNGPGLPGAAMKSIFDPFFIRTEGPQDFGLNLMGTYFLVYHYGGKISAAPSATGGLNFFIDIPVTPPPPLTGASSSHEFVTKVLMNDTLWERLLPHD